MDRKNVVNIATVTLMLGLSLSARAQAPAPAPEGQKPAAPPATVPMSGVSTRGQITCEVVQVDGNYLLVKLESGEVRVFNVDPERKFIVDGVPLSVGQLKPGTVLTATFDTKPPVGAPVDTVTGKVWYASGSTVILTLPDGTNKSYKVPPSFQFIVGDQPATVNDLRKGMKVTAHRIPEPPAMEICYDIEITGTARK